MLMLCFMLSIIMMVSVIGITINAKEMENIK
jgi:hypothetical protein